jgi:hypothetical protein
MIAYDAALLELGTGWAGKPSQMTSLLLQIKNTFSQDRQISK